MRQINPKVTQKIIISGLALIIFIGGFILVNIKTNFYPPINKKLGEVAAVTSDKFLNTVSLVGAAGLSPYQNVTTDVSISGRVGIGTNSPGTATDYSPMLHIKGGTNADDGHWSGRVVASGPTNAVVMGELYTGHKATIGGHNSALTAWSDLLINPGGGNVGIGTITPGTKLDVSGQFHVGGGVNNTVFFETPNAGNTHFGWGTDNFITHNTAGATHIRTFSNGTHYGDMVTFNGNGTTTFNGTINMAAGNTISGQGGRILMAAENQGDVAEFAAYGLYLPKYTTYSLYAGGGIYVGYSGSAYPSYFNGSVGISTGAQTIPGTGNTYRLSAAPVQPGDGIKLLADGTNSPGYRFESSGGTYFGSLGLALAANHFGYQNQYGDVVLGSASNIAFVTGASLTRRMIIDSGGNVNIINGLYHNGGYHSGWDYAEYIKSSDPSIEAGDLVAADPNNSETIVKSGSINNQSTLGIVSTKPGDVGGLLKHDDNSFYTNEEMFQAGYRMLALAGRVPVKVSNENGPIKIGDPLTSSSIPGVAMKATRAGTIVGKAVENFNGGQACASKSNYQCGKITALLNISWYDPDVALTSTNGFHLDFGTLKDAGNNLINRIGAFAEIIVGKVQAGIIETKQLIVNGVDIVGRLDAQQKEIDTLKLEIEQLKK